MTDVVPLHAGALRELAADADLKLSGLLALLNAVDDALDVYGDLEGESADRVREKLGRAESLLRLAERESTEFGRFIETVEISAGRLARAS